MRVRYDDQIFLIQRRGGVSRYFVELIRAFAENPDLDVQAELGWRWTRNAHAMEARMGGPLRIPGGSKGRVLRWANRTVNVTRSSAELTHCTYYGARYLSRKSAVPMVATVHDMTPELFPDLFPKGNPHQSKAMYLRRASLVLCVSESTRRDLASVYGAIEPPTAVTYLGVSGRFVPGVPRPPWCPDSYVLFLGNRGGYKDFRVAVEAFAELSPKAPGTALLAVGGGPFTEDEEALIWRWNLSNTLIHKDASDAELPGVFGGASAFVFPSRYEGFGLPTLEAMACGTPAVLADSSSHPEVGGDAALYFPPGDSNALADTLLRLLSDVELSRELSRKGLAQSGRFTWRRTAVDTADAYRIVRGRGSPRF
jgi:glycosyltransferase involved in cell wall biosynthesis